MNMEIVVPDQEEVQNEATQYPMQARALAEAIKDDDSYQTAGQFLITIKGFRKKVESTFGEVVSKAHAAWKATIALRKLADDPLDEAERIIKPALAAYDQEQERVRRAEQDRIMAEQKKRDEDSRLAQAAKVAETGDLSGAEAILDAPAAPLVMPPPPPKSTVAGISYSDAWKAEVIDLKALVKAVAEGKAPLTLLEANTTAINSMAKSLKAELKYPGIRVWSEKVVSSRAR